MKKAVVQPLFPSPFRNPAQGEQEGAHPLDHGRNEQHIQNQLDNALQIQLVHRFPQNEPFLHADLFAQQDGDQGGEGHKPQTADLNQNEDHHFAEGAEGGGRILHRQPRHTGGGGGGKQGVNQGKGLAVLRGKGHHEEDGSDQNSGDGAEHQDL